LIPFLGFQYKSILDDDEWSFLFYGRRKSQLKRTNPYYLFTNIAE